MSPKDRAVLYVLLLIIAACAILASVGCASVPTARPGMSIPCSEPEPLSIPLGTTSNQLDELLAMAYWDLLAQYHACQAQQVKP